MYVSVVEDSNFEAMKKETLTPQQALQKVRHFCAYQERCHSETKERLYQYGLNTGEVEEIIASLIEDNYLDEERFAQQFTGGKFRVKKWGKVKIRYELRQRQVSDYCIKKALQSIDEEDYRHVLKDLLVRKKELLKIRKPDPSKERKLIQFFMQRGFEQPLIRELMKEIEAEGK